jgi:hypothetical protein
MTVRTYRNIAAVTAVLGLIFGAKASSQWSGGHRHGFGSGLNAGMAAVMLATTVGCLWLARFVRERLHLPLAYWQDLQRRHRRTIFSTVYTAALAGSALSGLLWLSSMEFASGVVAAPTGLCVLLAVGQLTGQARNLTRLAERAEKGSRYITGLTL